MISKQKNMFRLLRQKLFPIKIILIQTFVLIAILRVKLKKHRLIIVVEQSYAGYFAQLTWLVFLIYYCKKLRFKPMVYLRDKRYNTGSSFINDILQSRFETCWREDDFINKKVIRIKHPVYLPFFKSIVRNMSHENEKDIISQYLKPSERIEEAVADYILENSLDDYIGVHFRGTDKHREAPIVRVETFLQEIRIRVLSTKKFYKNIYLASDSEIQLNRISNLVSREFPWLICNSYNAIRSEANLSLLYSRDFSIEEQIRLGDDALIECLILSKADLLIRNSSNLSNFCIFFNLNLEVVNLNKPYKLQNSFPNLKSFLKTLGED